MKQSESHVFYAPDWNSSYQVAEQGEGIYIYTSDGRQYLDGIGGIHLASIGYGVQEIAEAMAEQARKISFAYKAEFTTQVQEELADTIINLAPNGMDKVIFATGGSIANEMAIQIAQYYHMEKGHPNKYKVIGRWHSYHGRTIATLSVSGSMPIRRGMSFQHLNSPHIQAPHCFQCPFKLKWPKCRLVCAEELARTIEQEGPDSVAAFIAEPIIGGAGSGIVPKEGYYERIREICDYYNILFIAEEVVTGFGRTGKNFGIDHWRAVPDIITSAKGLSSGYAPIGAVIIHKKVCETFFNGKRSGIPIFVTYSGHPVSCAAALAVQKYVIKHNLIERCATIGKYLKDKLQNLADKESIIGDVRGEGLLIGIEFVSDKKTDEPFARSLKLTEKIIKTALENGLIIRGTSGTGTSIDGDHLLISPPFIITENQCDELVSILENSIIKAKQTLNL